MNYSELWTQKGATLSDKTATKEYGITRNEIIDAINAGDLQYREGSTHGSPWFRLLRVEVEAYIAKKYGAAGLIALPLIINYITLMFKPPYDVVISNHF